MVAKRIPLLKQKQQQLALAKEYQAGEPLTDFSSVAENTDLTALNLNWTEQDLPERARTKHVHRLHPYLGKYIPQLVEIFLRKYRPRRVYDPFLGSGTTLVEANVLGIEGYGTDISAFNCLLSKVKTAHYDINQVRHEVLDALRRIESIFPDGEEQPNLFEAGGSYNSVADDSFSSDYLREWFAPMALRTLLAYRQILEQYRYADLLKVILSRTARSSRLTRHFDLEFPKSPQREPYKCYKHRRICLPTADALGFLRRYSLDTIKRLQEFATCRTNASVHVLHEDARSVKLPPIDLVLTSPPYIGLIDYHEQHRYAYELLQLERYDDHEIGAAFKGKSKGAHISYIDQIGEVFENAQRFMRKNAVAVVVVGDRENLYEGLGERLGFVQEMRLRRHVNRRTGRRSTDFFEDVLIWRRK